VSLELFALDTRAVKPLLPSLKRADHINRHKEKWRFQTMGKASQKNGIAKPVVVAWLTPIEQMSGDSKKDTLLLKEMAGEEREFLLSFKWCRNIRRSWFGWGVGGVCAVFSSK